MTVKENLPEKYADLWIELVRKGYDLYRDHVNTPAFLKVLPPVKGLSGLDVGCGEGHNTRLLAKRDAIMSGIDISPTFIKAALEVSPDEEIAYSVQSATELKYSDDSFDFTVSFFALQEIKEFKDALREIFRVTKKGGFFQFCITHPCFWTPKLDWKKNGNGELEALLVRDYFKEKDEVSEWIFDGIDEEILSTGAAFETRFSKRTLSTWINALIEVGFTIELIHESQPSAAVLERYPSIRGSAIVPFFLVVRCKK